MQDSDRKVRRRRDHGSIINTFIHNSREARREGLHKNSFCDIMIRLALAYTVESAQLTLTVVDSSPRRRDPE